MANKVRVFRSFRIASGLLLFCGGVVRLQATDDVRVLLVRVSQNVVDTVGRLPRYVCTQTIDRSRYEPDRARHDPNGDRRLHSCDDITAEVRAVTWKRRLATSDRLRLDVAVGREISGVENEMYAWAGADRFSDSSLFELVRDGAVSTGSFASMLSSLFGGKSARFAYNGDSRSGGRLLSEFGFRIPEEESDYLYMFGNGRKQQVALAYYGTFLVDPETSDLVRLVVHAGNLPRETGACELTQTFDYQRVRLNGSDFLLPAQARLSVTHADETEAENVIRYSACHEFQGESTLRFPPLPETELPVSGKPPAAALALPPRLPFQLLFTDPIDTATAAAGDPVRARLKTAIRDQSSRVLVPEGTAVAGRIVSIRRFYRAPAAQGSPARKSIAQQPALVLTVRLEALEVSGTLHPFKAAFDSGLQRFAKVPGLLPHQVEIGPLDRSLDSDTGIFNFWDTGPGYIVASGLESNWLTLAP